MFQYKTNWDRLLESGCSTLCEEEEEGGGGEGGGGGGGSSSDMVGWSKNYRNTHEPRGSPVPGFITQVALTVRVTNVETEHCLMPLRKLFIHQAADVRVQPADFKRVSGILEKQLWFTFWKWWYCGWRYVVYMCGVSACHIYLDTLCTCMECQHVTCT